MLAPGGEPAVSHTQTSEADISDITSRINEALRDRTDLHEAHGLLLTQILTKGRAVRKNKPSFVAEKAIEMYDYQMFFEPSIREARRRRVERKLESLDRCIQRINEKYPESSDDLAEDYDRQDIISVNLERGVQSCVDLATHLLAAGKLPLPESAAEAFRSLAAEGTIDRAIAGRMDR